MIITTIEAWLEQLHVLAEKYDITFADEDVENYFLYGLNPETAIERLMDQVRV